MHQYPTRVNEVVGFMWMIEGENQLFILGLTNSFQE